MEPYRVHSSVDREGPIRRKPESMLSPPSNVVGHAREVPDSHHGNPIQFTTRKAPLYCESSGIRRPGDVIDKEYGRGPGRIRHGRDSAAGRNGVQLDHIEFPSQAAYRCQRSFSKAPEPLPGRAYGGPFLRHHRVYGLVSEEGDGMAPLPGGTGQCHKPILTGPKLPWAEACKIGYPKAAPRHGLFLSHEY